MEKKKLTKENLAKEKLLMDEEEQESYLNYIKNYYGDVHYHVYAGAVFVEQSGTPPPPPPYGGGG